MKHYNNQLILHLPLINAARDNNYSFKEISNIFKNELNLEVNDIALKNFHYLYKSNKTKSEFKRIKCFYLDDNKNLDSKYNKNDYIVFMNSFCIVNEKIEIDQQLLINETNLINIKNPVARIYAKWLTRNFHINDSSLLYDVSLSDAQLNEIQMIPQEIDSKFNSILKELLFNKFNLINLNSQINNNTNNEETIDIADTNIHGFVNPY